MSAPTAKKSTKRKKVEPLRLEVVAEPEKTFVLFTWGDKEFFVPESEDMSPNVMTTVLETLEENPMAAIALMFRTVLGDDQYKEFTKLNISQDLYQKLVALTMEHLASTYVEEEVEEGKA